MDICPVSNLYQMIRSLAVVSHRKRQWFLCELVEGMVQSRSVHFSQIADKIAGGIKEVSKERRIQDFFQKVEFDFTSLAKLLLSFVHHDNLTVSIDRTEWDYGKTQVNILCVAVSIGRMAVPIYFEMLDNKSGNSNRKDRKGILEKVIRTAGPGRIGLLVMDREFIGQEWLKWLKVNNIPFCVRVPSHHTITFADGTRTTAEALLGGRRRTVLEEGVAVDGTAVNLSLGHARDGEMLYLIGTLPPGGLKKAYDKRWGIEVLFQALKKRGFDMEASCLRDIKKYRKLFAVASLAYTICWATGIQDGRKNPVKVKKHGYPQYSVFRRGLDLMRQFYKNKISEPIMETIALAMSKLQME